MSRDVPAEHPYIAAINPLRAQGIIVGYESADGAGFRPGTFLCGELSPPR